MVTAPDLSSAAFNDQVDTAFRVAPTEGANGAELEFRLFEHVAGRPSASYESFALRFRGPDQPLLPQGTYRFDHDHMGRFEMFIVPLGPQPGGFVYEAVFNRLLEV